LRQPHALGEIVVNKDNTSTRDTVGQSTKYVLFSGLPKIFIEIDHGSEVSSERIGQGRRLLRSASRTVGPGQRNTCVHPLATLSNLSLAADCAYPIDNQVNYQMLRKSIPATAHQSNSRHWLLIRAIFLTRQPLHASSYTCIKTDCHPLEGHEGEQGSPVTPLMTKSSFHVNFWTFWCQR
jgi:hypothetical protein